MGHGNPYMRSYRAGHGYLQLEQLAVGEAGSFVQVTSEFGIAAKSFCRCGVSLDHQQDAVTKARFGA